MSEPSTALNLCVTPYVEWVFEEMKAQGYSTAVSRPLWEILQLVPVYYACTSVKHNAGTISGTEKNRLATKIYDEYAVDNFFLWVVDTAKQELPAWATHELFGNANVSGREQELYDVKSDALWRRYEECLWEIRSVLHPIFDSYTQEHGALPSGTPIGDLMDHIRQEMWASTQAEKERTKKVKKTTQIQQGATTKVAAVESSEGRNSPALRSSAAEEKSGGMAEETDEGACTNEPGSVPAGRVEGRHPPPSLHPLLLPTTSRW